MLVLNAFLGATHH